VGQAGDRGQLQYLRGHGQPARGPQGRHCPLQTNKRPEAGHHQEGEHQPDGLQVHGEHRVFPGRRGGHGRPYTGDLPDSRPVGETEPQLCRHLSPVSGQEG